MDRIDPFNPKHAAALLKIDLEKFKQHLVLNGWKQVESDNKNFDLFEFYDEQGTTVQLPLIIHKDFVDATRRLAEAVNLAVAVEERHSGLALCRKVASNE